nr:hypothetical protein [Tanacetum cinerariifolium]
DEIIWLMASMGSSSYLNTRTVRPESSWGNLEVLMIDWLGIIETDKMIHTVETDILKLVVEIKSFGMGFDEFDKEIVSVDELQLGQADLSCVTLSLLMVACCRGLDEFLSRLLTDMVIHIAKTKMMRVVVEIECVGKIVDAFDKPTGLSDGLQPEQVDLNYVHGLNEPNLHEIHVVPSKHEVDQHLLYVDPLPV